MKKKKVVLSNKKLLKLAGLIVLAGALVSGAAKLVASSEYNRTYVATVILSGPDGEKVAGPRFLADHLHAMGSLVCFRNVELDKEACVNDVQFEFVETHDAPSQQ